MARLPGGASSLLGTRPRLAATGRHRIAHAVPGPSPEVADVPPPPTATCYRLSYDDAVAPTSVARPVALLEPRTPA